MDQRFDDQQDIGTLPTLSDENLAQSVKSQADELDLELQLIRKPRRFGRKNRDSNVGDVERTPFIHPERSHQPFALPAKCFKPKRTHRLRCFQFCSCRISLYRTLASVILLTGIVAPISLVTTFASNVSISGGNLPFVDCVYTTQFTFEGIDLLYGHMPFSQAKAIDLAWNTLVGRSLQTVISIFTYKVFMKALMRITEQNTITYEVYAALALSTTKLSAVMPLTKSLYSKLDWRARISMAWLLISTIYLATFPTLMDAITGYQAARLTKLKLYNGSTADLSQGVYSTFTDPGFSEQDITWWVPYELGAGLDSSYLTDILPRLRPTLPSYLGLTWQEANRSYFRAGQFFGSEGSYYSFMNVYVGENATTTGPSNSSFYVYPYCIDDNTSQLGYLNSTPIGSNTTNVFTSTNYTYTDSACADWLAIFSPLEPFSWDNYYGTLGLNSTYLSESSHYECVSTDAYQWGFSYAWLLVICSINVFWLLGTWAVYLDAEYNSEFIKKGRGYGTWRAILDLAESVNHDLGPNTCAYSEDEIIKALEEKEAVGYVVEERENKLSHIGLRNHSELGRRKLKLAWDQEYGQKRD